MSNKAYFAMNISTGVSTLSSEYLVIL